jgi:indolepyruvate ferredoxin oxidoreductase alpha subunit
MKNDGKNNAGCSRGADIYYTSSTEDSTKQGEISETEPELLSGNEAIARAAYDSGVRVATAYPGTPSTEILENISKYPGIYCQWSVNEKVALEVASGASISGARTLAAMKHVGLNVAADPFMTLSYTGVTGGLVIISADDPYMHSSQNEQDNRFYAKFAKVPCLEPSDSQEAYDMVRAAFEISENYDTPVIVRSTTRISHSRSLVKASGRTETPVKNYEKSAAKFVMIPSYGRERHKALLERWEKLKELADSGGFFSVIEPDGTENKASKLGIITSGVSYQYAAEVFSEVPVLKIDMISPLPEKAIKKFAEGKKLLLIIEELEPFLEEQVKLMLPESEISGKQFFPAHGELGLESLKKVHSELFGLELITGKEDAKKEMVKNIIDSLPPRPPVLCAGCPHRPVFHLLKKLKTVVMGDIGCYTLSVLPPLSSLDSCLCMGAGIGQALGMEKANPEMKGRVVSVIGDSTFFHSGITPLIDSAYNKGTGLIIILDNGTTAMTGRQSHPGTGTTLMGDSVPDLKPEDFARAAGIKNIRVVDPYRLKKLGTVLKEELEKRELSVIVCRRPCVLLEKKKISDCAFIDQHACKKCGLCTQFGCPAIEFKDDNYSINPLLCNNCGVCADVCKWKAIITIKD